MSEVELSAVEASEVSLSASLPLSDGTRRTHDLGESLISSTPWCRHEQSLVPVLPNPFQNDAEWATGCELFKSILVGLTLGPFRLAGLLVCTSLWFALLVVVSIGHPLEADRGCLRHISAFQGWRRTAMSLYRFFTTCIALCLGFWRIRVLDRRQDPSRLANIIVISPHLGLADPVLIASALSPIPSFLGRNEMSRGPAYFLACGTQAILVNLRLKESKLSCKEAIASRAASTWDGPSLAIFPEGSITNGRALTQFKEGAFCPGEPVTPVLLRVASGGDWDPSWVGENRRSPLRWFLRLMCQFRNSCSVEILDTYTPDAAEREDPCLYANNVRSLMAAKLQVPTTEHAYDDVFFYQDAALKARVQCDFTLAAMQRLFDTDLDSLKGWLDKFQAADIDGTGVLSREEVIQALGLTDLSAASVDHVFDFFDTDGSGAIEYREFVQVVALLSGKCSPSSLAKLAFLLCDTQGTGWVAKQDLLEQLDSSFGERRKSRSRSRSRLRSSSRTSTVDSRVSSSSGRRSSLLADHTGEMLNFQDFCRLVDKQPEVLSVALNRVRSRLGCEDPGASTLRHDEAALHKS